MDANKSLEFIGEDVEAAIAAGLRELGVGPMDVMVEVIDEPSRGVFGIGAKPAKVRLKLLRQPAAPSAAPEKPVEEKPQPSSSVISDPVAASYEDAEDIIEPGSDGDVARQVLEELLQHMGVKAQVGVSMAETEHPGEDAPWKLDVRGEDVSILIGRRGDTLSSLQYITRLITSRRIQKRANIIVDAGEYKSRRSDRLHQLALRMADQAITQKRTVSLEPMPANERRIIHLALRHREDVETRSTGEGASRKVTIVPK